MPKPILPKTAPATSDAAPSEPSNAKPVLSKEQKKALFAVPRTIDDQIATLQDQIAECEQKKSAAIKDIQDQCGHGPFQIREGVVRISSRTVKKDDGSEYTVHFFKGKGTPSVEKID